MNLYLKDGKGTALTKGINRVVHGKRGSYIEFEAEHLCIPLYSKFNNSLNDTKDYYYFWLYPENHPEVKIYYQLRTVKYADYKVGKYYISTKDVLDMCPKYVMFDFTDVKNI